MPLERSPMLQSRYKLIRSSTDPVISESIPHHAENQKSNSEDYATFLKEKERKVGPDGFVDSSRYSYTYSRKAHSKECTPREGVLSLQKKIKKEEQSHEKCLKVIEDLMWQHKQEERELKRIEGDIVKNQQAVRHTLRDYENAINKKKMAEDKKLSFSLDKYTVLQQDRMHEKEKKTQERIQSTINSDFILKDTSRKLDTVQTDLARKYKVKLEEIELKRLDLLRLNQEYESKLRLKENEQFKLKQQAAELALSLNMETQKGRVKLIECKKKKRQDAKQNIMDDLESDLKFNSQLAKSGSVIKNAELQKRKLSADLYQTETHLNIRKRDEQRHLIDTKMRLNNNINTQRQLNEAAMHVEMDKVVNRMGENIKEHDLRRSTQMESSLRQRQDKQQTQKDVLETKFRKRFNDQQRRVHEDSLHFFQKMVSKDDETEQNLYNKVRSSEYNRQKQEQVVRHLEQKLSEMKKKNTDKLNDETIEKDNQERHLQQKIQREKSELNKLHIQREESYLRLQKHRQNAVEDRHLLVEHEKAHNRLMNIAKHSDAIVV